MRSLLKKTCNIIYVITIMWIIYSILTSNKSISCINQIICIPLITFVYRKISKKKIKNYMFVILFAMILILQIISANLFKVIPSWDFGIVYNEATDFCGKVNSIDYFCTYPNNIPILLILKTIFFICKLLNITSYLNIGIAVNVVAIDVALIMLVLVIKEMLGKEKAFFTLFFISLMPVIYLAVPIFYTDTLSMPFPIIMIYIFLKIKKEQSIKKKIIYSILLGIATLIGMNIKITVVITFIAIMIYEILLCKNQKIKKILYSILSLITIIILILLEILIFKYKFKEAENLSNKSLPMTHHIMMALDSNRGYSQKDFDFTASFETREEKRNANIEEIKVRIKKYDTFEKMINFIKIKELRIWSDGTYSIPSLLSRYNVKEGKIQNLIFENNKLYIYISKLQRESLMLLILIATFYKKGEKEESINIISRLSILGLIIFFSFWEIRSRYIINYIPILTLVAILGIDVLNNKFTELKEKKLKNEN